MDSYKTYVAVSSSPSDEPSPFGYRPNQSIQQSNNKSKSNWKPTLLRTFSLVSIFVVTLFLIGCLQWAINTLPNRHLNVQRSYSASKASVSDVLDVREATNTAVAQPLRGRRHFKPRQVEVVKRQETPAVMPETPVTTPMPNEPMPPGTTTSGPSLPGTNYAPPTSLLPDNPTPIVIPVPNVTPVPDTPAPVVGGNSGGGNQGVGVGNANAGSNNNVGSSNSNAPGSNAGSNANNGAAGVNAASATAPRTSVYTTSIPGQGLVVATRTFLPSSSQPSNPSATASSDTTYSIEVYGVPKPWTQKEAFIANYLPVLIAVFYRLLWATLLEKLALVDPFRQLTKKLGAPARDAFFQWYQRPLTLLAPFKAFHGKRRTLLVAVLTNFVAGVIPALASESIVVDTNWICPAEWQTGIPGNPCPPVMVATVVAVRTLQGVLALMAVALIVITISLWKYRTGLTRNPSSIIGVAQLMGNSELAELLHQMPDNGMDTVSARQTFGDRRFELATWLHQSGNLRVGITPFDDHGYAHTLPRNEGIQEGQKSPDITSRPATWHIEIYSLLLLITGVFGVILAYHLDGSTSSFNNFFNSNTFGPRFILTLSGTIIVTLWQSIEQDTTVMAPYTRLYSSSTYATHSDLTFQPTITPLHSSFVTFTHRYYFPLSITLTALLGQALNITISGVPYAPGVTTSQYNLTRYLSLGILALMLITGIFVARYRYQTRNVPVRPFTLGAKMSTLVGSRVVDQVVFAGEAGGAGVFGEKRYCLRSVQAGQGGQRWIVDEVVQC